MNKYLVIFCILIVAGCSVKLREPLQADVNRSKAIFPSITLAELTEGKSIYENRCSVCHGVKRLTAEKEAKWRKIVPIMVNKANKRAGKQVISSRDQEILLQYILAMR